MGNKIYIVENCDNGEYFAFTSEVKAKEFMLKSYLKNDIINAKYCVADSTNVDDVVNVIKADIECILEQGYLEDTMYMSVAELDKEVEDDE
jgi:CRISPR/Cas system-associated protein Cas7 (RAMP superfamily)